MSNRPGEPSAPSPNVRWDIAGIADILRSANYDVEPPGPGDPPDSSVVARRDFGDRSILLTADRGGRFRIEITWLVGEWPSRQEIAGIPVRVVDSVTRAVNLSGQITAPAQLLDVLTGLGSIVSWAGMEPEGEGSPPATPIET